MSSNPPTHEKGTRDAATCPLQPAVSVLANGPPTAYRPLPAHACHATLRSRPPRPFTLHLRRPALVAPSRCTTRSIHHCIIVEASKKRGPVVRRRDNRGIPGSGGPWRFTGARTREGGEESLFSSATDLSHRLDAGTRRLFSFFSSAIPELCTPPCLSLLLSCRPGLVGRRAPELAAFQLPFVADLLAGPTVATPTGRLAWPALSITTNEGLRAFLRPSASNEPAWLTPQELDSTFGPAHGSVRSGERRSHKVAHSSGDVHTFTRIYVHTFDQLAFRDHWRSQREVTCRRPPRSPTAQFPPRAPSVSIAKRLLPHRLGGPPSPPSHALSPPTTGMALELGTTPRLQLSYPQCGYENVPWGSQPHSTRDQPTRKNPSLFASEHWERVQRGCPLE